MKRFSILVLGAIALTAAAQNKIDFPGRLAIEEARLQLAGSADRDNPDVAPMSALASPALKTYGVIVQFNGAEVDFGDLDVEVLSSVENLAVVNVTPDQMEAIAALPQVKAVSLGYERKALLKNAREATGVDDVHAGTGLASPYTGKGVIAGLFDTGLDVNHVNFKDADNNPRTKRLWVYSGSAGRPSTSLSDPTAISNYTTETSSETHGTHVLGIIAGGYKGAADFAAYGSNNRVSVTKQTTGTPMPYYGVAPDAELAVSCGPLYNSNIVDGVQKIIEYAESQNKPAVVNLSLGSTVGPHDGTDATSQYLDALGKRGIIFISAGNDGNENISVTTTSDPIKTFAFNDNSKPNVANGILDLWGSDNRVFTVRILGFDTSNFREAFSYTLDSNLGGATVAQGDMDGFSSAFSGTLKVSSNINPANNRYNVSINPTTTGKSSNIIFGIEIIPQPGQSVDGFTNSLLYGSRSMPGFTDGTPDNSINDMACGHNVIVVGSFSTMRSFPLLSGSGTWYEGAATVGSRSNFSSYGWTADGRLLPDVCAPGEVLVSSLNEYYVKAKSYGDSKLSARYTMNTGNILMDRNSSWGPMQGTSMASPFAAGVAALWLEANPEMTVEHVRDVIRNSSDLTMMMAFESNKWGAGKINALKGLKYVLDNRNAVDDITTDGGTAMVSCTDGHTFDIYVPGTQQLGARLHSLAGLCVAQTAATGNSATLSADGLTAGVYVLAVTSDKGTETFKVLVK